MLGSLCSMVCEGLCPFLGLPGGVVLQTVHTLKGMHTVHVVLQTLLSSAFSSS